jgi:hypothetical protein
MNNRADLPKVVQEAIESLVQYGFAVEAEQGLEITELGWAQLEYEQFLLMGGKTS